MPYATGSAGLAITVRGSSRRIMIMRFRPANISLINRRHYLPRLLLILSSKRQIQKPPQPFEDVDRVTPYQCPDRRQSDLNPRFDLQLFWMSALPCLQQLTPGTAAGSHGIRSRTAPTICSAAAESPNRQMRQPEIYAAHGWRLYRQQAYAPVIV